MAACPVLLPRLEWPSCSASRKASGTDHSAPRGSPHTVGSALATCDCGDSVLPLLTLYPSRLSTMRAGPGQGCLLSPTRESLVPGPSKACPSGDNCTGLGASGPAWWGKEAWAKLWRWLSATSLSSWPAGDPEPGLRERPAWPPPPVLAALSTGPVPALPLLAVHTQFPLSGELFPLLWLERACSSGQILSLLDNFLTIPENLQPSPLQGYFVIISGLVLVRGFLVFTKILLMIESLFMCSGQGWGGGEREKERDPLYSLLMP